LGPLQPLMMGGLPWAARCSSVSRRRFCRATASCGRPGFEDPVWPAGLRTRSCSQSLWRKTLANRANSSPSYCLGLFLSPAEVMLLASVLRLVEDGLNRLANSLHWPANPLATSLIGNDEVAALPSAAWTWTG